MKIVLQRVKKASVDISGARYSQIGEGLLLLLGVSSEDTLGSIQPLIDKILKLRVFNDTEGKMNLSLQDIQGSVLIVSQFTLYANTKKGNRPSFVDAAKPEFAQELYNEFIRLFKESTTLPVQTGVFGADMDVDFINWGPVTLILES